MLLNKIAPIMFMMVSLIVCLMVTLNVVSAQNVSQDIENACAKDASSPMCAGYTEGKNSATSNNPVQKIVGTVVNLFAFFGGAIAVIYVVYGGFKYVTSAGNAEKASSGRQTIFYALIGLVVIIASQQLVLFVISKL